VPDHAQAMRANRKLVLASNNPGKLREFSALLAPLSFSLVAQGELGVPEAEEPYPTFVENALTKARHAAQLTGLPALADDSGLCVQALRGAPGVYSARYAQLAGGEKSDAANNARLLAELAALPASAGRRAYFYCVLAYVRSADDPQPLIAEGRWDGEILDAPRGAAGFGYDPLFYVPSLALTAAEMESRVKSEHSHRALALRQLLIKLELES
jgi:XTP/dITP diphosphohydrolase